jgi:hypothetical protein
MAELKVRLSAETEQAAKDVNNFARTAKDSFATLDGAVVKSINEFKQLQAQLQKTTDPRTISALQRRIGTLADEISTKIPRATQQAAAGLTKLNTAAGGTNTTLINFGRVVQDAPFGIIGIANNIDPLVLSFQNLKRETGSTGGAFKALLAGLTGPAGIAIGISAVTSALIAFGPQIKAFFQGTKALTEEQKKLNEELVNERGNLILIQGTLQNENASRAQKLGAIKKLRDEYGPYLKDLSDEELLSNNAAKAISLTAAAILNRAKARAFEAEVFSNVNRLLEIEAIREANNVRIQNEKNEALQKTARQQKLVGQGADLQAASTLANALAVSKLTESNRQLNEEEARLSQRNLDLAQKVSTLTGVELEKEKSSRRITEAAREQAKAFDLVARSLQNVQRQSGLTFDAVEKIRDFSKIQADIQRQGAGGLGNRRPNVILTDAQIARNAEALAQVQQLATIGQFAAQQLGDAFNAAFTAISQGDSPIKAITQSIRALITRLAAAAAAAALLSALLPGGLQSAAFGGKGFGAIFGQLFGLRLASGGIATGPTPAIIGDGGPEAVIPLSQLQRLLGGGNRGGNGSTIVTGNLRGDLIYLTNQRGGASYSRLFG